MNIIESIRKDHQELREYFEKLTNGESVEKNYKEMRKEILPHHKAEDVVLYPLLMEGDIKEDALEGLEEHHAAELLLDELDKTSMDDERWKPKLKVLKEVVEHHIMEEEAKILVKTKSKFDEKKLKALGKDFDAKKKEVRGKMK